METILKALLWLINEPIGHYCLGLVIFISAFIAALIVGTINGKKAAKNSNKKPFQIYTGHSHFVDEENFRSPILSIFNTFDNNIKFSIPNIITEQQIVSKYTKLFDQCDNLKY